MRGTVLETYGDFKFAVGGLVIAFRAAAGVSGFWLAPDHRRFVGASGSPDCVIDVHFAPIPDVDLGEKVFQSDGLWGLHVRNGLYSVPFVSPPAGPDPYRLLQIDASFSRGDLYISSAPAIRDSNCVSLTGEDGQGAVVDPLSYPLDELLVINLLARLGGLNFHACGVDLNGRGFAFCGRSGAGKSTLASLWKRRGASILSDDRLILRQRGDGFWVYGTPWHGEASLSFPGGVPLEAIYFLVQAPANSVRLLQPLEAASRLVAYSFSTFYDSSGMDRTLRFVGETLQRVPCYELSFLPDESTLDYLVSLGVAAGAEVRS